jgi:hypothetical protein
MVFRTLTRQDGGEGGYMDVFTAAGAPDRPKTIGGALERDRRTGIFKSPNL